MNAPWKTTPLFVFALSCLALSCGDEDGEISEERNANQPADEGGDPNPMRMGPEGCYIGAEMRCDCELEESECGETVGGLWTEGCASCSVSP